MIKINYEKIIAALKQKNMLKDKDRYHEIITIANLFDADVTDIV